MADTARRRRRAGTAPIALRGGAGVSVPIDRVWGCPVGVHVHFGGDVMRRGL